MIHLPNAPGGLPMVRPYNSERDLQAKLRADIEMLEPGLTIIDGGKELIVPSGRVDITAQDRNGTKVIIELKFGRADRYAVAQLLSYMGAWLPPRANQYAEYWSPGSLIILPAASRAWRGRHSNSSSTKTTSRIRSRRPNSVAAGALGRGTRRGRSRVG